MKSNDSSATEAARDDREFERAALLSVKEVAALLACSPRHVRRLADAGKMPQPVRLGALIRWDQSAIKCWIAEGCPTVPATRRSGR